MRRTVNQLLCVGATVALAGFALPVFGASAAVADPPATTPCGGLSPTIVGTGGDDVITGTDGDDVIAALSGNDRVDGGLGNDVICGGPGADVLQGQGGDDEIFGDEGADILDGGEGGCCLVATNTGDDVLHGGGGNDVLHSSDFPTSAAGNQLFGDGGSDELNMWSGGFGSGGAGDDFVQQFTGDAVANGDNGNDHLVNNDDGGFRSETVALNGGSGDDVLENLDATGTTDMDGAGGLDTCTAGTTTANCEG